MLVNIFVGFQGLSGNLKEMRFWWEWEEVADSLLVKWPLLSAISNYFRLKWWRIIRSRVGEKMWKRYWWWLV